MVRLLEQLLQKNINMLWSLFMHNAAVKVSGFLSFPFIFSPFRDVLLFYFTNLSVHHLSSQYPESYVKFDWLFILDKQLFYGQLSDLIKKVWNLKIAWKASNCLSSISMKSASGRAWCTGTKYINYPNTTE